MAIADFKIKNGLTVDNNVTVAGTSLNLGTSIATLTTATIGGAITGNVLKLASTTSGTVNLTTDVTTGTVNEWTGITTGTVNLATGGASTTNIGGSGSTLVVGKTSGNSTLTVNGNTAATINIANTSGVYQINGTTVLNSSTLGSGVTSSSLTTVGTIGTGVWNGTIITGAYGGTGVANTGKTITLGGNLTTSGAFATTITASNTTSVTLPTSGTLVGSNDTGTVTNTMLAGSIANNKLTNSSITVGTTSISLGSSSTTLSGVTSIDGGTSVSQTLTIQSTTGVGSSDSIIFKVGNNSTAVTINTSGNVGIGETTPTGGKLVVKGSGGSAYITSAGTGLSFTNDGTNYISTTTSNGQLQFQTGSSTNAVLINSSGNVVIGTGEGGATPVGNTIRAPSGVGTNITGSNLTITAGNGTGTGGSGSIYFQTAPTSTTGTTANTLATVVTIDNTGSVTIAGNLTVNGTTTTVNSTTITVNDKNIELGKVLTPTNTTADGGGITLKGATDKTWNWVNSTSSWTSSENIDMASGKAYYINGTSVLNSSTLGSGVTGSSLTSVGTLTNLTVTNTISGSINGNAATVTNGFYTTSSFYLGTTSIAVNRASGTQTLSGITSIDGGTSVSQALTIQSTTGNGSSDSILFKVGNNGATTAMKIDTLGRVGINTTSPSYILDVVNPANAAVYNDIARFQVTNNAGGTNYSRLLIGQVSTNIMHIEAADQSNNKGNLILQGYGGNVGIGTTSPAVVSNYTLLTLNNAVSGGGIYLQSNGTTIGSLTTNSGATTLATATAVPLVFYTNSAEAMRLDSSGNLLIGTTSAYGKLFVSQANNNACAFFSLESGAGAGNTATRVNTNLTTQKNMTLEYLGVAKGTFKTDLGAVYFDGTQGTTIFQTAGTEAMRIGPAGDVAIGGTLNTGTYKWLTVTGPTTSGGGILQVQNSDASVTANFFCNNLAAYVGTGTNKPFLVRVNSNEVARFDTSGNVGIGNISPTFKVDLTGGSLGGTIGNQILLQRLASTDSNVNSLEITETRDGTGTSWTTAATRLQEKIDSTWMGFIQFNGTNNNGGITFGTGTSTVSAVSISERIRIDSSGNMLPAATNTYNLGSATLKWATMYGVASSANYADLAERYTADDDYEPGTVLEFGGANEVTISNTDMSRRIAGVVSTNPGYLMNAELESEFVVSLALTGRVPCKVQGAIRKGDMMVSASNGYARAEENPKLGSVIGKALEDFNGITGVIEIVVGRL